MEADDILSLYEESYSRLAALAVEAKTRPKITTADEVMEPLFFDSDEDVDLLVASLLVTRSEVLWLRHSRLGPCSLNKDIWGLNHAERVEMRKSTQVV